MEVLVGIPTHKRPELLRKCLKSIAAQEGELPDIQVFVADNDAGGKEGSAVVAELAPDYRFPLTSTVVEEPGISAVRNAILAEAKERGSDFIAMIDDDETASPEWLSKLLDVQTQYAADLVGGPVEFTFQLPPAPSIIHSSAFVTVNGPSGPISALRGCGNLLVSTRALSEAAWPSFDVEFGLSGGEDSEWFAHLASLGFKSAWCADASVTEEVTPDRITPRWILQRAFRAGNSTMRSCLKHGASRDIAGRLADIARTFATAPFFAPFLLTPKRRLRIMRRWWAAGGQAAALVGHKRQEYVGLHLIHGSELKQ